MDYQKVKELLERWTDTRACGKLQLGIYRYDTSRRERQVASTSPLGASGCCCCRFNIFELALIERLIMLIFIFRPSLFDRNRSFIPHPGELHLSATCHLHNCFASLSITCIIISDENSQKFFVKIVNFVLPISFPT